MVKPLVERVTDHPARPGFLGQQRAAVAVDPDICARQTKRKRKEEMTKVDDNASSCTRITRVANAIRIKANRSVLALDWRNRLYAKEIGVIWWD
jgi:hypothetical protein